MKRGYQNNFSVKGTGVFDAKGRQRKAHTTVTILKDYCRLPLGELSLLNIGGSAGIIDEYLSAFFKDVVSIDIDEQAIEHAKNNFKKDNLKFEIGDAMNLQFCDRSFDVVICSHVYEHVPCSARMMEEIYRVLKPDGVCFFAAGNRLMWNEPHYNLPLLSVMPRFLAHSYVRMAGKADFYYEKHLAFWGLQKLIKDFDCTDYTLKIIQDPVAYGIDYMLNPGSIKAKLAELVAKYFIWLCPGYIWLLRKP